MFLNFKEFLDVALACGDNRTYQAHKVILVAASPKKTDF